MQAKAYTSADSDWATRLTNRSSYPPVTQRQSDSLSSHGVVTISDRVHTTKYGKSPCPSLIVVMVIVKFDWIWTSKLKPESDLQLTNLLDSNLVTTHNNSTTLAAGSHKICYLWLRMLETPILASKWLRWLNERVIYPSYALHGTQCTNSWPQHRRFDCWLSL